jgi:predicted outer membrane repeat protein
LFDRCRVGSNSISEGGAIYTDHNLSITSCVFSGCSSYNYGGGAIGFYKNNLEILNSSFLCCVSYGSSSSKDSKDPHLGGAIRLNCMKGYFQNCSFLNCKSNVDGGAIGLYDCVDGNLLELDGCVFVSNTASNRGGALDARGVALKCTYCSFLHNSAGESGSAISGSLNFAVEFNTNVFVRNIGGTIVFKNPANESSLNMTKLVFFQSMVLDDKKSMY